MSGLNNVLTTFAPGEVKYKGYGGWITDFVVQKQLLDVDTWSLLVNQYRLQADVDNRWRGEYWGKMMRGASLCYTATKNEKLYAVLSNTVKELLTLQERDGRISSYPRDKEFDGWDLWCRKYVLLGYLYFYEICKSKLLKEKILKALEKHLDYIVAHIGDGDGKKDICKATRHFAGLNSCSILEPVVKMYSLTGKQSYLDFASYIVKRGFCADADYIKLALEDRLKPYQYPYKKAYEMTSCFQGLLEYYKIVKNERYLLAVTNFWKAVVSTDLTICGSSGCNGEMFNNSSVTQTNPGIVTEWENGYMQETCVTVTWMNLCYTLLKFTGDARYGEYLESSVHNALYGAVNTENQTMYKAVGYDLDCTLYKKPHESFVFDSYSPLLNDRRGKGIGGFIPLQNGRSYGCCACIGSAGIAIANLYNVMKGENGIYINGYSNYLLQTNYNGQEIKVKVIADLYKSAKVKIIVSGGKFKLHLRAPKWSERFDVVVDGVTAIINKEKGYAVLDRDWQDTEINVYLNDSLKKIELNGKVAIKKGAVVLARDERFGENVGESVNLGRAIRGKKFKNDKFKSNVAFKIKTKDGYITVCDYASAGKRFDDENCKLSVWMPQ